MPATNLALCAVMFQRQMSLFKPLKVVVFKLNLQKDNDIIAGKFETVSMGICVLNHNKDTKLANNRSLCLDIGFL